MNNCLAPRHLHPEARQCKAATDAEDYIRVIQKFVHCLRYRTPARAQRQGMVLGESTLALEARGNRDVHALRQLFELRPGPCVMNALAGIDDGLPGPCQYVRHLVHFFRIRRASRLETGNVGKIVIDLFPENIHRHFHQYRTTAPVPKLPESPSHHLRQGASHGERLGPFGDVLGIQGGIEIRKIVHQAPLITARHHQNRYRFAVRLRNTPECVFRAGAMLHDEYTDVFARAEPADRVRHV